MNTGKTIGKLLKVKGIGYMAIALVAGIALLLMGRGGNDTEKVELDRNALYAAAQEERLCAMGKEICGVGCGAAVIVGSGYTYSYAGDQSLRTVYNADGTVAEKEISLTNRTVNTKEGTALVAVRESAPTVKGVAMVCRGASDSDTMALKQLIMALYSLKEEAVFVTN